MKPGTDHATRRTAATIAAMLLFAASLVSGSACAAEYDIPPIYREIANETGVPPGLLYAIAKAESNAQFSGLPWPWTLNVQGRSLYFRTRQDAEDCLHQLLRAGIRSIDIGPMQVNWRWHADELVSPTAALDPVFNVRVGARFLRQLYAQCGNWVLAAGRYHSPDDSAETRAYSAVVLSHWRKAGLQ